MKTWTFVVVVAGVAVVAFPSVGRAEAQTPAQATALERLESASSTPVSAELVGGAARFVAATVPVEGDSPEERALAYLDEYRDVYGLASPRDQLHVVRETGGDDGDDVFFGQSVEGVPIDGAQLAVHLRGSSVVATNGSYLPLLPAAVKPVLSAAQATEVAQKAAGDSGEPVIAPELVYVNASLTMNAAERELRGLDDVTRLAWRVTTATRVSVVDALTGRELVGYDPDSEAFDLSIRTVNNTGPAPLCGWPGAVEWFDEFGLRPGANPDAEGIAAFNFAHAVYGYYFTTFGRLSFDGADAPLRLNLDVPVSLRGVNAMYDRRCHDISFTNNMATLDVMAHEFTHGVTDFTAHLDRINQPGALDEHYSDFFAAMIDGNWTIAEGSAAGIQRIMSSPRSLGDPDNMLAFVTTTSDNGGVHTNAGIPNKVAFLITDGGFFRGFQLTGIGRTKSERLYYHVLTRLLTSNSNFVAQRNLTVLQADQWAATRTNGFTAADACTVRNAFAAGALGEGDADCDGTGDLTDGDDDNDGRLDGVDNCAQIANPTQLDTDSDGFGNACDPNDDNDLFLDASDNCPLSRNDTQADDDGDGLGNACDPTPNGDLDADGIDDARDNCRGLYNPDQGDVDHDGLGNACDPFTDTDRDGIQNAVDNCPDVANPDQADGDHDAVGDACDNAPTVSNYDQADTDGDGRADVLDPDDDDDGVLDAADNCQLTPNAKQEDSDRNGIGDACENTLSPFHDLHSAFTARDEYFERLQIVVDPCVPKCEPAGDGAPLAIHVDSDYKLELRLLDPRGELVATGVSGEPLTFDATGGDDGLAQPYTLEILPSPEFEPGQEYPFTAWMDRP